MKTVNINTYIFLKIIKNTFKTLMMPRTMPSVILNLPTEYKTIINASLKGQYYILFI